MSNLVNVPKNGGLVNTNSNTNFPNWLDDIFNRTVGNYLIRLFFDAKSDEIVNIYSDGATTRKKAKLKEVLKRISTSNSSKWKEIK